MLESPAYWVLSLSARRVLSRIEIEHAHHGGKQEENGKLPVTYADFESYGVHHASIRPAISELEALGFIEITRRGRAGNAEFRTPNLFRLTYRPAKGIPDDGSHEWRRIETMEQAEQIRRRAARRPVKKQNSNAGKRAVSLPKTTPENDNLPLPESGMTVDISGWVHVVYGLFRKTTTPSTSYGAAVHVL